MKLCKKNLAAQLYTIREYTKSGRSGVLLLLSPLRTVRASFPAYGSSF